MDATKRGAGRCNCRWNLIRVQLLIGFVLRCIVDLQDLKPSSTDAARVSPTFNEDQETVAPSSSTGDMVIDATGSSEEPNGNDAEEEEKPSDAELAGNIANTDCC